MDNDLIDTRRNHHVKKLLTLMGGHSVDVDTQKLIKRSFSEFAEDIKEDGHNEQTRMD